MTSHMVIAAALVFDMMLERCEVLPSVQLAGQMMEQQQVSTTCDLCIYSTRDHALEQGFPTPMHKLSFTSGKAVLCLPIDSYKLQVLVNILEGVE